ncbi:MAG TPA: hypothetical protein GX504_06565 [Clostridia bacterium]|nr:hypothetical protein [Clostridia bacterium]
MSAKEPALMSWEEFVALVGEQVTDDPRAKELWEKVERDVFNFFISLLM